jgi:hypothetical protein
MKEKKARIEDALHATRAAVEEGVVRRWRGLLRASKKPDKMTGANEEYDRYPFAPRDRRNLRRIVMNAGPRRDHGQGA